MTIQDAGPFEISALQMVSFTQCLWLQIYPIRTYKFTL